MVTCYAALLRSLGLSYLRMGRCAQAEALVRKAMRLEEKLLPVLHPSHGASHMALAQILMGWEGFEGALPWGMQALASLEKILGPGHWRTAFARSLLGEIYLAMDLPHMAKDYLAQSAAALHKTKGEANP